MIIFIISTNFLLSLALIMHPDILSRNIEPLFVSCAAINLFTFILFDDN